MKSLKIANIKLKNPLLLSPMVEVTDLPYRMLCRKQGASMAYTEMLYVDSILHENVKTKRLLLTSKEDKPVGLQVTGNSAKDFENLADLRSLRDYDLIDINCGCPSFRIVGNEAGSYLLEDPEKIVKMIKTLKAAGFVTTAKIRLGFKKDNSLKVAKKIEKAGADALTVHARLAIDSGKTPADWSKISLINKEIGIPVIGNGDVFDGEGASRLLEVCDGIMIARAAIGNPMIFKQILHYLKTGKEKEIGKKERVIAFSDYLKLQRKYYGDGIDLGRVKYVGSSFLKGFSGAAKAREAFMKCKSRKDIERFVITLK